MSTLIPNECIQCEIVLGGRLRNPMFIAGIKTKQTETLKSFEECVADYMYAFHNWSHKG